MNCRTPTWCQNWRTDWCQEVSHVWCQKKDITFPEEENKDDRHEGHCIASPLSDHTGVRVKQKQTKKQTFEKIEPVLNERSRESFWEEPKVPRCANQMLSHYITCILLISDEGNESIRYTNPCTGKTSVMCKCLFCFLVRIFILGTSLVVQWVRHSTPNARDLVSIPGRELDPTCMPQLRSPHAATKDPPCWN